MASSLPAWSEQLRHAYKLRAASALIDRWAPAGSEKTDILIRLGRLVATLERLDTDAVCRRCGVEFTYAGAWFMEHGFAMPRHCGACRDVRRLERRRAGAPNRIPRS